eukprot:GFKZ01014909.1.p1 GENE.GFKZ01014909.1~~GFKZ01014909.1.p1  ORF type:complete len:1872 (+),score=326.79 GFKZ01014909.1:314-5929(+)
MEHTSSSSSSRSSASMDDSERESYGYLVDDNEEPEEEEDDEEEDAHDYDDIPEDEEDEDDDMDEDDDEDDDDDAMFTADIALHSRARQGAIPLFRSFASGPANGLHLEHFLTDAPIFSFPPRASAILPTYPDRDGLRSIFVDTWANLPRADVARIAATQLGDSVRLQSDSLSQLTSRIRGGLSAMLEPRASDHGRSSAYSVHPLLCRPPVGTGVEDAAVSARSIFSAIQRSPSFTGQVTISAGSHLNEPQPADPRLSFANAVLSVQGAYRAVIGEDATAPDSQDGTGGAAASSSRASAEAAQFAEQARSLNQEAEAIVARLSAANGDGRRDRRGSGRLARTEFRELADRDLLRSVQPVMFSGSPDYFSGFASRNRTPYVRCGLRERERDKVASGILRRWVYDPPSCSGDSLPAIFDDEVAHRGGRHAHRVPGATAAMPVIAPESHEAVAQLATKVTNKLDNLLTDLAKVDAKIAEYESQEKARKEAEDKRKKRKRKKTDEDDGARAENDGAKAEEDGAEADSQRIGGSSAADPLRADSAVAAPTATEVTAAGDRADNTAEDAGAETESVFANAGDRAADGSVNVEGRSAGRPDAIMDTVDDAQDEAQDGRPDRERETNERNDVEGGEARQEDNVAATSAADVTNPRNSFAEVAAQRAAAAGISLDAPANENPEVVAAATQSTGIDPAFIAALPEDMRAEILNQYYEQIHTNSSAQAGAAASQAATTVNQDFLIALPPALRAEVLELEAEFMSRQQTSNTGENGNGGGSGPNESGGGGAAGAAEMDNASFLATLAPELREEILLTSGEAFIQSLPPSVAAEARVLRERGASRMGWRANAEFGIGFDERRLPSRMRELRNGQGRQGGRNQPREPPVYQWKKLDKGWLREGPKTEAEPAVFLEMNGLASMMKLLWLRQGHYGKTNLYQVLAHACKSTESRLVVLQELIGLIVSSSAPKAQASDSSCHSDVDRTRQRGTAVRRALELLILLCKNDPVVAETLLGLPRDSKEVDRIPVEITDETPMPEIASDICLSALVSLLDTPLFTRSNSHLEQLVSLINTLCLALPPTLFDGSDRRNEKFPAGRRRRLAERAELGDPISFLIEPEDEPQPIFQVTVDEDEDSMEDDFDPPPVGRIHRDRARRNERTAQGSTDEASAKNKNVVIPPQYRIPGFKGTDLVALTKALLRQGCSERSYERVSRSIAILGELIPNRIVFVDSLVEMAVGAGRDVHEEYAKIIDVLKASMKPQTQNEKRAVISSFSIASAGSELMLLRVVKCLSALWSHEAEENTPKESREVSKDDDKTKEKPQVGKTGSAQISTERQFRPYMLQGLQGLWNALDKLLELVSDEAGLKKSKPSESKRPAPSPANVMNLNRMRSANRSLSPILARLSPMIESFLVTHSGDSPQPAEPVPTPPGTPVASSGMRALRAGSSDSLSNGKLKDPEDALSARGLEAHLSVFVEKHRGPINALLRANPALLETSFKGALRHPHAIDFDNKKAYFRNVIRKRSSEVHAGTIRINVRRDRVFDDSYHQLRLRTPDEMKGRLHVLFTQEEGVDAGGVTREWYIILARQIFDPNYVLFTRSAAKAATYQPDKRSYINKEHLENFRFVGRIIGKAIYDGQLLDAYFTRSFYKHILGMKPTYHDIEAQDPEYYNSLKWMLENDITGILDYTMSAEYDEFGKQTVIDLVPNGRNIPVTEENKAEYVRLMTEVRMTKSIEKQIAAFKEGFHELIPLEDCKIFNELELELLMSGLPDIDMADLKANVEYTGYTASSPQINWFWRCVSKMNQEDLARLVMFVTGTSKVPLEGFSTLQGMNGVQKFQIHRTAGNTMRLPSAHTCFNQLDLPEYSTAEILSERLLRAVRECSVGFGFA